jgi:dual specificity phosphatase 12
MGKSRSATVCVAYLLHKYPHHTPASALAVIRQSRPFVEPNSGFMKQLELYHQMRCPADLESQPAYQRWVYQRQVEASLSVGKAPDHVRFEDEVEELRRDSVKGQDDFEFKCRKCRLVSTSLTKEPPCADPRYFKTSPSVVSCIS